MAEKRKQISNESNYVDKAIQSGINSLIEAHPRFANFQDYLMNHVDVKKIDEKVYDLKEEARERRLVGKKRDDFIGENLANYVSSGEMIDEKGKEVILKNSLEEKTGLLHRLFHKQKFNGEKYLDNTMEAFQDLYALFKSGSYAEKMPELKQSVSVLHDMQFLDPAVDVLKSHGLIDSQKYKLLKENIYSRVGEEYNKVVSGIEKRIMPEAYQKVAASIFLVFGTILLISNLGITGAIIGSLKHTIKGITGISMLIISALLFLISNKKT